MLYHRNISNSQYIPNTENNDPTFSYGQSYIDQQKKLTELYDVTLDDFIKQQKRIQTEQIKHWGENPRVLMQIADRHLLKKEFSRAREIYEKIISLDKQNLIAYDKAIISSLSLKDINKVIKYFSTLIEISNKRPDIVHNYVIFRLSIFNSSTQIDELMGYLEEILKNDPNDYQVLNTYAIFLLEFKNDVDTALTFLNRALKISNNYVHAINNIGVCYLKLNKNDESIHFFKKAININENYVSAYENLASAFISLNKLNDALEILNQAIDRKIELTTDWEHHYGWLLLQNKELDTAIDWYIDRISREPNNDLLYNNLGVAYKRLGKLPLAAKYFQLAIKVFKKKKKKLSDERSINAFYNLGRLAVEQNNLDLIRETAQEIKKIRSQDAFALFLQSYIDTSNGNYDEARDNLEKAIHLNPLLPEPYTNYSFLLTCLYNDNDRAIEIINSGIERGVSTSSILNNLAYAYARSGDLIKAKKVLDKMDIDENHPSLLATRGLVSLRSGNFEEGNNYYQRSVNVLSKKNPKLAEEARQIWLYEQALHISKNGNKKKAVMLLNQALQLSASYIIKDINTLLSQIS